MGLKEKFKPLIDEFTAGSELKGEQRVRNLKFFLLGLKYNLMGLGKDSVDDEVTITKDSLKIWLNNGVSVIIGLVTGIGTYFYCGKYVAEFSDHVIGYRVGIYTEPPNVLLFILTMLWCGIASLALSLVVCGAVHVILGLTVTCKLDAKNDVRMTGVALNCIVYVLLVLIFFLIGFPIPGVSD